MKKKLKLKKNLKNLNFFHWKVSSKNPEKSSNFDDLKQIESIELN